MTVRNYPPLPEILTGIAGDIEVTRPNRKKGSDYGEWFSEDRRLEVNGRLRKEVVVWHTFLHELAHASQTDAGIHNQMKTALIEPSAEAMASQMMHVVHYLVDHYEERLKTLEGGTAP